MHNKKEFMAFGYFEQKQISAHTEWPLRAGLSVSQAGSQSVS